MLVSKVKDIYCLDVRNLCVYYILSPDNHICHILSLDFCHSVLVYFLPDICIVLV